MRSLAELTGMDLQWRMDIGITLPSDLERHYVLWHGDEPVVTAQVIWQRLAYVDFIMEAGEGTYQVHMDLTDPQRRSVAWRTGSDHSLAGFVLESEGLVTAKGWITTASGRRLAWEPTHSAGYEYVVFEAAGPRLITVSAAMHSGIGGNPGHMLMAPATSADPELPALAALGFTLACEQAMLLHRDPRKRPGFDQ